MNKPAHSIADQIALLKQRGMLFRDETVAFRHLGNISYYRLRGYWWDMQSDFTQHVFKPDTYFEDVIDRYNFDRRLRLILFDAIERIEIALRTKMIYHLSMTFGSLWYLDDSLFDNTPVIINGATKTIHQNALDSLQKELD
jgi:abortive infection bacteriophage resistance protein